MSLDYTSFEGYLQARKTLIEDERSMRRDHQPLRPISDAERAADVALRALRASEAEVLWKAHKDPNDKLVEMYPGMGFLTAKDIIHKSAVFRIIKEMPKGAMLHAHFDAILDFETLLDIGLRLGGPLLHVSAPEPITSYNVHTVFPTFHILDPSAPPALLASDSTASLTSATYTPEEWIPVQVARDNFKLPAVANLNGTTASIGQKVMLNRLSGLEGPTAFDTWTTAWGTIDPAETHETINTVDAIWKRFQTCFIVARGISYFEPVYRAYLREIFEMCVRENISYIEIRLVFWFPTMARANGKEDFSHAEWMMAFAEELAIFKNGLAAQGLSHKFVGSRIIYTGLRFCTDESLDWCLNDCIKMKQQFPDLIAGFDLVGQEDAGRPLIHFAKRLLQFREEVDRLGLDIPFLFHAGETLGDGTETDKNLYDAILLGTKRIGHGFSIARHPKLLDLCRERDIMLEVCPISNEILRLTSSMPTHPLPTMLGSGVPVTLSSDDPGIFGSLGLAYDYYQVFVGSEINSLTTLGTMAFDGILFSEMLPADKELAMRQWHEAWQAFVERVAKGLI